MVFMLLIIFTTKLPPNVAAARPLDDMKPAAAAFGSKVVYRPQAKGQAPPDGPNPCTHIPSPGKGVATD
ncbi:hypothetical protein Pyn_19955 [Prunus yedoensis var. nudiflora]|uniref:Uncharacterized protein n=1 Tax=Prunus yedoensis var. nudiflora TaxID=2094558 RepID=A0A314ZLU6_PRUYE|nr:hypothetical protein Pyn_19955 [Prunus yedoensis var. nudiflora]